MLDALKLGRRVRVGLVSDTHVPEAGALPSQLLGVFGDRDLILHCGDLHSIEVIDRLEELAPTLAARGNGDTLLPSGVRPGVPDDPRIAETHVLRLAGITIGLTHDLELAEGAADEDAERMLHGVFGETVDIAACGHTHVPRARGLASGRMILNPGSPTMPYGYLDLLGTAALLDLEERRFEFSVIDLESGTPALSFTGPTADLSWKGPRPSNRSASRGSN